ncbi:MAG TPA: VOC family protein, partial [Pricia sp.]|nr:VOC family protein [Pricia sp.]
GTTLRLQEAGPTAKVLTDVLGFSLANEEDNRKLYTTDAPFGSSIIIETADFKPSANGRGIIHHVAFRAKDDEEMAALRDKVLEMGLHPTEHIDRHWFHSVYFRSPGGVLFEIATDGPGYVVDEDAGKLGQKLILPPWLEAKREMIESRLPELHIS